jgi:hypothetical protein
MATKNSAGPSRAADLDVVSKISQEVRSAVQPAGWSRTHRPTRYNMKAPRTRRGEMLTVHPHCLMFFVDETGHEEFAGPNYPVFGLGGCAILAAAIENNLRTPWREMKARWFGGPEIPLHATDLRRPTEEQAKAIGDFFRKQEIGRFPVTMTKNTKLPEGFKAMQLIPGALRPRWEELAVGRKNTVWSLWRCPRTHQ